MSKLDTLETDFIDVKRPSWIKTKPSCFWFSITLNINHFQTTIQWNWLLMINKDSFPVPLQGTQYWRPQHFCHLLHYSFTTTLSFKIKTKSSPCFSPEKCPTAQTATTPNESKQWLHLRKELLENRKDYFFVPINLQWAEIVA